MTFTFASPTELAERREAIEAELASQSAELQLLEKDIDGYDTHGYAYLKDEVLSRMRDRIANLRMALDPKDHDANLKMIGRYEMIVELMTKPELLTERTKAIRRHQIALLEELKHTNEEIERDRQRRAV